MVKFGLVGESLGHSFSRAYFADKFARLGLRDHRYDNYELPRVGDVRDVLAIPGLRGLNVTIPYKSAVLPYLDALTPVARDLGAVNVVDLRDGRATGHNTDVIGFAQTLAPFAAHLAAAAPALVLGTGGAARAVWWVLAKAADGTRAPDETHASDSPTSLRPASATAPATAGGLSPKPDPRDRRATLADHLAPAREPQAGGANGGRPKPAPPYLTVSRTPGGGDLVYADLDGLDWSLPRLIVNTTPVGTHPDIEEMPAIPVGRLGPQHVVVDLVYNPAETALLRAARARGAQTRNGLTMLHGQAEAAWSIWNAPHL